MILSHYGIQSQQLYSITADNGANMLAMSRQIEEEIQNSIETLNSTVHTEESEIDFIQEDDQEVCDLVETIIFNRENIAH